MSTTAGISQLSFICLLSHPHQATLGSIFLLKTMAALHRLLCCLIVSAFCIYSTSGQGQQWGDIAFSAEDLLNAIRKSHADYLAQSESSSRLDRRGAGFGRGRANYWRPLAPSQRPSSAEDFSDQLSQLLGVLGSSLEELIQLIASQFDIGDLQPGLDPSQSTVLPITVPYLTTRVGSATTTAPAVTSHDATTAATTRVISSPPHTTPVTTSSSLPPPAYTFNPQASNLNVVYYSQTDLTPIISLDRVCADDSIDIVIVAFVTALFSDGGYPAMNMASNCWAPNAAQQAAGATKLLDCVGDGFANQIARCQGRGKRVLLSLGGSVGDLHMESKEKAVEAAHLLWNLFLGGSEPELQPLRPYGNVVFDGIDIGKDTTARSISPYPSFAQHYTLPLTRIRHLLPGLPLICSCTCTCSCYFCLYLYLYNTKTYFGHRQRNPIQRHLPTHPRRNPPSALFQHLCETILSVRRTAVSTTRRLDPGPQIVAVR